MNLLFKLALRNILRQRRRSLLTGLSMTGGYILCALSISASEGSYSHIIDIFTLDHTGHIQIHKGDYLRRPKIYTTINDVTHVSALLDANPAVVAHTLRVYAPALAYGQEKSTIAKLIGVDLVRERATSQLAEKVTAGAYIDANLNSDGYYSAMIGYGVAEALNLKLGDEIVVISEGADGSIANDIFTIEALIGKKQSTDRFNIFVPLIAGQSFLSLSNAVHEVSILLAGQKYARNTARTIQAQLPNLQVSPWQVIEETFYKSMQSDKRGNQISLLIIIFIVFIGVLNTVLMSVLERTREFGVLRAMGTPPATIVKLITLETTLMALISTIVGIILALPLIVVFAHRGIKLSQPLDLGGIKFDTMLGELSPFVFGAPMLLILTFAVIISIIPGIRAANISPTKAMGDH